MNSTIKFTRFVICSLVVLALLLSSCAQATPAAPADTPAPTNTPLPTNTATPEPTNTPEPTSTPIPTETPVPTPTKTATPNRLATQGAKATATMEAILAVVNEDLKTIELSTEKGKLGYYKPDGYSINNTEYNMIIYNQPDRGKQYKNFVLHTDISWESSSGLAGCGLILRTETQNLDGKALLFGTWRLSGYPAWDVAYWNYGTRQSYLSRAKRDDSINQENGDTNSYILVLNDTTLTVYVNGNKAGSVPIEVVKDAGEWGVFTRQESGETTCTFNNTWIWITE